MTLNPLTLHDYQRQGLDALRDYLRAARECGDAGGAFYKTTERAYQTAPGMDGIPYICLRVPTGGGKTLMACHALEIIADEWIREEEPAVFLWLAPTGAIVEQTLNRLRDKNDPYYQAVADAFGAQNLAVMDLREARQEAGAFRLPACIIVGTIQSLRRKDTDKLKVYEDSGALMKCFDGVSEEEKSALEKEKIEPFSLAALLRSRPLAVIVDEAHNARRPLSFQTLSRLSPDCIIEFTATPRTKNDPAKEHFASNILHHCSALELKRAAMIKLPIQLHTIPDWRRAIVNAAAMRAHLEKQAALEQSKSGEYLRPIALYQAEAVKGESKINVNLVRRMLIEECDAEDYETAIAVGEKNEVDADLLSPKSRIRHIITVRRLAEGWDCPFAYILCALSNIAAPTAVEQILGRVLRMPGAKRKSRPALNRAYAYAVSPNFNQTAEELRDALVEYAGFKRLEAVDLVVKGDGESEEDEGELFDENAGALIEAPDFSKLPPDIAGLVHFDEAAKKLTVRGELSKPQIAELKKCFPNPKDKKVAEKIAQAAAERAAARKIRIPMLAVRRDGLLSVFDEDAYLDAALSLKDCPAELSESEFARRLKDADRGIIDVKEGEKRPVVIRRKARPISAAAMGAAQMQWNETQLISWLDANIPHPDIPAADSQVFIARAVSYLIKKRGIELPQLAARRFALKDALAGKIDIHRRAHSRQSLNRYLSGEMRDAIEVNPDNPAVCMEIGEDDYAPNELYKTPKRFDKHIFPGKIGALGKQEERCAEYLDDLPQIKKWLRNLPRTDKSFWLPRPEQNRAYPDFIAELKDGRRLVVETKGQHLWKDAEDDRVIGGVWMNRSGGRCVYVMVKVESDPAKTNFDAIADEIKKAAKTAAKPRAIPRPA